MWNEDSQENTQNQSGRDLESEIAEVDSQLQSIAEEELENNNQKELIEKGQTCPKCEEGRSKIEELEEQTRTFETETTEARRDKTVEIEIQAESKKKYEENKKKLVDLRQNLADISAQ